MTKVFFVRSGNDISGPKTGTEIKAMARLQQLCDSDEIANSEAGPWRLVGEIPQLAAIEKPPKVVAAATPPAEEDAVGESKPIFVAQLATVPQQSPPPMNGHAPHANPQAKRVGLVAKQIAARGRKLLGGAITEGRQWVAEAYLEAMSSVAETETLLLDKKLVLGRGSKGVDKVLPSPQVSLRHAIVERTDNGVQITDSGSSGGTFVQGERIKHPTLLAAGDVVTIGPYSLSFDGSNLISESAINNAELICRNLCKVVTDRTTKKEITILDNVNLLAQPREFLVVLGPSGSGKSTLLNALAARSLATSGDVTLSRPI